MVGHYFYLSPLSSNIMPNDDRDVKFYFPLTGYLLWPAGMTFLIISDSGKKP